MPWGNCAQFLTNPPVSQVDQAETRQTPQMEVSRLDKIQARFSTPDPEELQGRGTGVTQPTHTETDDWEEVTLQS